MVRIELRTAPGHNSHMREIDDRLIPILGRYPELRLAIPFGSRVDGDARPDSDIDLALLANAPLSGALVRELAEATGSDLGCPVDIVDLHQAPQPITGQALKGRKLLGDNRTWAELLTRHLIDSADFGPLRERILAERQSAWTR